MTLSLRSRQAEADLEPQMRSPEQLALALPLVAVIGVMIVVAAVATGGSPHFVAIAAVGGFALCAVAPMALLEAFVGKPLRAALAQLRAARDGQPAPGGRPFAFGLVGDLVQLTADIRAAQSNAGALAQSPPFVELAEAIKELRASPPSGALDGAVERIETMLVYLAESLERRESHEKQADEAVGRVERSFTDMARLLSRETEALQSSVSSAALMVRNDIASTEVEDKAARTRVLERLESFEARVLGRLADPAPPDLAKFAELIRSEADATRRALRERVETGAPEAAGRGLDEAAAHLARVGDQIAQRLGAVDRVADAMLPAAQGVLLEATQRLEDAAASLEGRAHALREENQGVRAAPAALDDLRADLRALADNVGDVGAEIAARTQTAAQTQAERVLEGIAALRENTRAPAAELEAKIEALAGAVSALAARPAEAGFDRREIDHILQSLIAATQSMAKTNARLEAAPARRDGAAGGSADLADLRADLAALGERIERQTEAQASRLDAIESRVVEQVVGIERDGSATTLTALLKTTKDLRVAIDRLDALSARSAPEGGLKSEVRGVAEAVAALAKRLDGAKTSAGETLVGDAAERSLLQAGGRLDGVLVGIGASLEALSGVAAKTADLAALRAEIAGVGELAGRAVAEMATRVQAAVRSEADRVVGRIDAFDTGEWAQTQARLDGAAARIDAGAEALAARAATETTHFAAISEDVGKAAAEVCKVLETHADRLAARLDAGAFGAAGALAQTQARLDACVARIEAGGAALADAAARDGAEWLAVRADLAKLDDNVSRAAEIAARIEAGSQAQTDRVVGRLDALDDGALRPARDALAETESRWSGQASRFEAGVSALTVLAETGALDFAALRGEVADVGEAVARAAAELSSRFDTSSPSLGRGVAERLEALGGLVEAGGKWDQLAAKIEAVATAEAPSFAELEQAVGETASRAVEAAASRFDEISRAHSARLIERFAEIDRGVVNAMLQAFDAITKDLADTRARLDGGVEAGLDVLRMLTTEMGETRQQIDRAALAVESGARALSRPGQPAADVAAELADHARAQAERLAALEGRVLAEIAARDNGEARRAITETAGAAAMALSEFRAMTQELADAKGRLDAAAAHFEARAEALGAGRAPDEADQSRRADIKSLGEAVAGLAAEIGARFDAFSATRPERAAAAYPEFADEGVALDRGAVASALGEFQAMTRNLAEAVARFEAATAAAEARGGAPAEGRADFDDLRRELAAVGDQVADAVQRLDGRLDDFAAAQAGRLEALEGRLGGRAADASSLAIVRALSGDPSPEAAPGAGIASALATFRAMIRTLQEATERFEAATATVRALPPDIDRRIDLLARGQAEGFAGLERSLEARTQGLASMKQQLAAALSRLEETASDVDRGLGGQVVVTQLDTSLLTELRGDLREVGAAVAEALAGFAAKLESSAALSAAPGADWRQDIASLAELIADVERRLTSEPSAGAAAPPPRTPAAVAKIVLSLADSLDFRFTEIEAGLAELASRLPAFDAGGDLAAAGLASLVGQLSAASEVLKAGLSEFVAVSAALAEDGVATPHSDELEFAEKQVSGFL